MPRKAPIPRETVCKAAESISRGRRRPNENLKALPRIPSSSTLLNLACSEDTDSAWAVGGMINIVGDSSSGKSILALSCLAECCHHPDFKDYRIIYDDAENASAFDLSYLFGATLERKIESPEYDENGLPLPSQFIEDFHCNIMDALEQGDPFIYVIDSFDALDTEMDAEKIEEMRKARKKKKKIAGSYGMSKAKKASELFRNICSHLKKTKSVLIVISQTRDNINPMSFEKKTRSGGNALRFFALHEIWLGKGQALKGKGQKHIIGHQVVAKIKKNKLTGKVRTVTLFVYYDYGVDDISANIDFLVKEGAWKQGGSSVKAPNLGLTGLRKTVIRDIENRKLEPKVRAEVGTLWHEIEEQLKLNRKPKYR